MKHPRYSTLSLFLRALFSAVVLGLAGCSTITPSPEEPQPPKAIQPGAQNVATVLKVNKELGYVILETMVAPDVGQEAVIKRNGKDVGVLKITDDQSLPFVAADILSGNVFVGDAVLLEPAVGGEE